MANQGFQSRFDLRQRLRDCGHCLPARDHVLLRVPHVLHALLGVVAPRALHPMASQLA